MVFSLEHDIKVTKNHQNLLPTQSILVAHRVVHTYIVYLTNLCVNWALFGMSGPTSAKKSPIYTRTS
jgi:hypothetical protein